MEQTLSSVKSDLLTKVSNKTATIGVVGLGYVGLPFAVILRSKMQSVIVVGAGNWGKNLVSNFHNLGALAGVVELSPKLREGVANTYPDVTLYDDFQAALTETNATAVAIATPAPTHYELAMRAMEAGKDVFVEKPMTLTGAESIALAEYADQHDRVLMVGHLLLYQPAIAWMRDYIATGKLGKVKRVVAQRAKLGKVRSVENVWWSFSPHDVSVVLELLGRPQLLVDSTGTKYQFTGGKVVKL